MQSQIVRANRAKQWWEGIFTIMYQTETLIPFYDSASQSDF